MYLPGWITLAFKNSTWLVLLDEKTKQRVVIRMFPTSFATAKSSTGEIVLKIRTAQKAKQWYHREEHRK